MAKKQAFSQSEFDVMVDELLYREPISYDMLCCIADKVLRKNVSIWCSTDSCLRGRGYEEDIMQEIYLRLIKTTISKFLLKDGADGSVNNDPSGFGAWVYTVGQNIKNDFSNKVRGIDFKTENFDDSLEEKFVAPEQELDTTDEKQEQLKEAFSIILSANVNIYKVLTWLAQFVFVINEDITKIESNDEIVLMFEEKTLFQMYDMLLSFSKNITWIDITDSQNARILKALNETWNDDIVYGDVKYKEFFMKYMGEKSGKKSISDWMYRMNSMIKRKMEKKVNHVKQIARRDFDESSYS